ncbi:Putative aspartyl protease [Constantimarinum furrinae]|uniref:Aspartyl protease n=1 Tax=Constantimarinum furrinae TaxID=2562285 RepID=A0A7G8PR72_9FLAO|nr:Putative aspartyl protease [Constantimarinum furrinae]
MIIPVDINGSRLSFLLDTGVNSTLLFALGEQDSIQLNNAKPVKIKGLGQGGAIDALVSENNIVKIGRAVDSDHKIFVVLDKKLNFSTRMGVPIHGIIGFDLFKDFVIQTDYSSKRVTLYPHQSYKRKRCRKCAEFNLRFSGNKPYIDIEVSQLTAMKEVTLLIDSGSSDALWIFEEQEFISESPKNYFSDFLGLGLSGNIFGKRSKLDMVKLRNYELRNTTAAFPDATSLENITFFEGRDGSLGGEILRRFTVVMDYNSKLMTLKRNGYFNDPFHYDMSGLTIEHDGMIPVKDVAPVERHILGRNKESGTFSKVTEVLVNPGFQFFLAPKFVVAELREDSPAALAGIKKGDEVLSVNGKPAYRYKLYELIDLFSSKPGRKITMTVDRNGYTAKFKFILKELI